jgi:hypothetical protein
MVLTSAKDIKRVLSSKSFKVAIFGSARIKPTHPVYKEIYQLAKMIGERNIDLVTGGGPGLMEAANTGHKDGKASKNLKEIGLTINIPHEHHHRNWTYIRRNFSKFSDRLDNFMLLSNAVVVAPGGIGTMLELFYTWQLMQSQKIRHIPVILLGHMWPDLLNWMREHPVKSGFIDSKDVDLLHVAHTAEEAMEILEKEYKKYKKE